MSRRGRFQRGSTTLFKLTGLDAFRIMSEEKTPLVLGPNVMRRVMAMVPPIDKARARSAFAQLFNSRTYLEEVIRPGAVEHDPDGIRLGDVPGRTRAWAVEQLRLRRAADVP